MNQPVMFRTMLHEAVALHNEGARRLVSRRPMEAIRLIRRSMQLMTNANGHRATCASRGSGGDPESSSDDSSHGPPPAAVTSTAAWIPTTAITTPSVDDRSVAAIEDCEPFLHHELFFIYRRPLLLPTLPPPQHQQDGGRSGDGVDDDDGVDDLMEAFSLYSIFNLALCIHSHGIESAAGAPLLPQAMRLYQSLDRVLAGLRSNDHTPMMTMTMNRGHSMIEWPLFHCLVLNNLASLHLDQCEYEQGENCAQRLYQLAECTGCLSTTTTTTISLAHDGTGTTIGEGDDDRQGPYSSFLTDHEVGEIAINGMFFERPVLARAA